MTERLLQFIWQFQYYNRKDLETAAGDQLQIIFPGHFNSNQGPDFSDAKIRLGKTVWAGSVELHLKTSDWSRHGHSNDVNYNNVVLHVVFEDDEKKAADLPLLILGDRIPGILLKRYEELLHSAAFIPCQQSIQNLNGLVWRSWLERLIAERLLRRTEQIGIALQEEHYNWEEISWRMIARNFGIRVNAEAFESMARSIPFTQLSREKAGVQKIEALLFGQTGLLNNRFRDEYVRQLKKDYRHLRHKYKLQGAMVPVFFLRMRPNSFPTLRLSQLASLVFKSPHLFSFIKEAKSLDEIREWLDVSASEYWKDHYRFDEISGSKEKRLGGDMADNIIINTICPLLFAHGNYYADQAVKDKAVNWLESVAAESNRIISGFRSLNVSCKNALEGQALLELKTQYCDQKRCLDCSIGHHVLKS